MTFSDDDLAFLRDSRISKNNLVFVAILATLVLGIAGFLMGHRRAQPARAAAPVAVRPGPAAAPAKAEASPPLRPTRSIQRERNVSNAIREQEQPTVSAANEHGAPVVTPPTVTATAPQSQRVQATPAATPLPREKKILTHADMDAEIARRNEQNARDKAAIDRLNKEKEAEKEKRMRLAEKREREERLERLLREAKTRRHTIIHRRPPKHRLRAASR